MVSQHFPHILVTGANGFVGRDLCQKLLSRGFQVTTTVRRITDSLNRGSSLYRQVITGELDRGTDWSAALAGVDVVIHLAARVHVMHDDVSNPLEEFRRANVAGTEHLARSAVASGVKRFVYVSTVKVNGDVTYGDEKMTEAMPPSPQDPYGISKHEAEQALHLIAAETGLEIVIVRPPLVYGAGVKGNFAQMIKVLAKGIPLPLASVQNLRSMVYVENLVDALILCATHPAAAGQTYMVSDGEDISTPDLVRQLCAALQLPARLFPCPPSLLKLAGWLFGKSDQVERLLRSLRINSDKIRSELNWRPPHTLEQGMRATVDGYKMSTHKRLLQNTPPNRN